LRTGLSAFILPPTAVAPGNQNPCRDLNLWYNEISPTVEEKTMPRGEVRSYREKKKPKKGKNKIHVATPGVRTAWQPAPVESRPRKK